MMKHGMRSSFVADGHHHQNSEKDAAHGDRCVNEHEVIGWVDPSSMATSIVVESGGYLVKGAR